jgi:hypothetical protein
MALTRRQLIGTGILSGLAVGGGLGLVYARRRSTTATPWRSSRPAAAGRGRR